MTIRWFACASLMIVLCLSPSAGAREWARALYLARDITAAASADDGVSAKNAAHASALRRAVDHVMRQLARRRDHRRLPLSDGVLNGYVTEYSVKSESVRPTYYRATFDIRLNRRAIVNALRAAGIAYTEHRAPAQLVMPVVVKNGRIAWDDETWRMRWKRKAAPDGIVPLAVFNGSREDRSYLSNGLKLTPTLASMMALRYESEFGVLAVLEEGDDGAVKVSISGNDSIGPVSLSQTFGGLRGHRGDPLDEAIEAIIAELDDRWKSTVLGHAGKRSLFVKNDRRGPDVSALEVGLVPDGAGLRANLSEVRQKLVDLSSIHSVEQAGKNRLVIHYRGDLNLLQTAFAVRGISLAQAGQGWWLSSY